MQTRKMKTIIYDESNPPDTKELLDALLYEKNDPRSHSYQRVLYRPNIKWGCIVCIAVLWIIAVALTSIVLSVHHMDTKWIVMAGLLVTDLFVIVFAKRMTITAIRIYQRYAPCAVRNKCRFEPSCSEYMIMSIQKYGLLQGVAKGGERLKRCNINSGGFDYP